MAACKSCAAPIIWTTSPAEKALPLDARSYHLLVTNGVLDRNATPTRYRTAAAGPELLAVVDSAG